MSHDAENATGAPSAIRWIVLSIVAFASASAYLTRYCISAANTTIQKDLGFDDARMGQLMSAFALGYLLCQVPGGWLGNRFGTRIAFAMLSVFWSLCNLWSAMGSAFHVLWASRFSLGLFQAGLVPVSARIISDWIPIQARGFSSALITASMSIGGAFAMWLTGRMLDLNYGWRIIFTAYSAVGIGWAIGFVWYFRTLPKDHRGVNEAELLLITKSNETGTPAPERVQTEPASANLPEPPAEDLSDHPYAVSASVSGDASEIANDAGRNSSSGRNLILHMVMSAGMWGICIQSFFRAAGYAFFVTWFFAFLEYAYGISKAQAGVLNSLPLIAVVVGSLSGGLIVDGLLKATGSRWISRTGTAIVSLSICGLLTMASAWTATAAQLSLVIALGALFSGIGGPAAWAATIDIGGRHTAVVMGVMNMAGCLAGVILPTMLGSWFELIRQSGGNWNMVIYLHAAFYFAGALSWLVVNPNREL